VKGQILLRIKRFMKPIGQSSRDRDTDGAVPVVLYLAPWAFVVLAAIKLKQRLLNSEGGGYDFLAEVLGVGQGGSLAWSQRLALFRDDVLVAVVIGGIVFIGLIRLIPPRLRALFAWVTCTSLFLILYAQLKSWWEVGTFISAGLMTDALFGAGRDLIGEYATSASMRRLYGALLAIAAVCAVLALLERRGKPLNLSSRLRWASWPLAGGAAVLVATAWASRLPPTPFDRAATTASLAAFAGRAEFVRPPPDLSGIEAPELLSRYARLANAPVPNKRSMHFGKARGYDVVFLLMESLPEVCYGLALAEGAMPSLGALERTAFVPSAHYSTYPYSRRAYSSIFSSWYPLNGIRGAIERYARMSHDLRAPGVTHSAAVAGYETAAFVPERPVTLEEDQLRYAALGFETHEVPPSAYEKPEGFELNNGHRDWVRTRDNESLAQLKLRMARAIEADQRYLYSFNPQITHGPWPGLTSASTREATCRAGFPLFREVDGMVGELVSLLRNRNRLDRTLILALGDHGLRTRREYPPFHPGTLDDVTFHVPLVLYAPGIVSSTERIPWMTSHIDIAPSVLDLLGIETDRDLELGSPMWERALADRATFFFARGYLGADGVQRSNEAVMVRYLYGGVSRSEWNGTLTFQATDLLRQPDAELLRTVDDLTMMAAIQTELSRTLLPSVGHLSRPAQRRGSGLVRRESSAGVTVPRTAPRKR
jgi:hypothetical protein